ncbi:hypothetical protein DFP73DRAFT_544200 [Morchella snyderi]|nr:hypothetical protein DFP73DRAFT_544200 [Morchella snyderi]
MAPFRAFSVSLAEASSCATLFVRPVVAEAGISLLARGRGGGGDCKGGRLFGGRYCQLGSIVGYTYIYLTYMYMFIAL